jgi:hypothetical protein
VRRASLLAAVLLLCMFAVTAQACPVCYGAPDEPMVRGMSNGILTLLGFIGVVQIGFVALFINFWRRAKQIRERKEQFRLIAGGNDD